MSERLTLTDLQFIIRDSLYMALPEMYWVIAEISELKENSAGHCYLELIEKNNDEDYVKARVRGIIWSTRYRFIKSLFENVTGDSIREGLKVLVKAKIEYHELYGLSLVITDIDPAFTIGEQALKKQLVIHRLEKEGVFTMNKDLDFPYFPQRIAIISSNSAAGYRDFIDQLTINGYGYVFYYSLFESTMQGTETEKAVINALDRIANKSHLFDLVVIIRGGGSQSDLSWFDSYGIAYHITQFPLPVITGIGHDKDMSVTDMVAYKSLKTPTAAAEFIVNCLSESENNIYEMWQRIKEISVQYASRARLELLNQASRITAASNSFSKIKNYSLEALTSSLKSNTLKYIENKDSRLNLYEISLGILNPDNVLKRGYTITSRKGKILKSREDINGNDVLETRFRDGTINSKVIN